jgi:glycine/D-amino acid oxidase-like deaminating enzyme/nitrite reductase/ring-hydroxylating ferredoxin subunit
MARSSSLWIHTTPSAARTPLTDHAHADVCVVGAGIAGLTTAYLLARDGRRVVTLDDGTVGCGQTAVTTAHLSSVIDDGYTEMIRLHGVQGAQLAYQSHRAAIDRIEAICDLEGIACDFRRVSGYLFSGPEATEAGARDLEREMDAARQAGVDVERLARMPEGGLMGAGLCLHFPRQGQIHPLKYLSGLANGFERAGGRLHTGTHVATIEGGSQARVVTTSGLVVRAGAVVVATNVPVNDLVAIHTKQAPYHSYVIGARLGRGSLTTALYWDTEDPYHYVRLQRVTNRDLGGDNDEAVDIVIVGGEDHKAGQAQDAEQRFGRLETWMRAHVPGAGAVEFRWSGQVMETLDGLAFIGRNPLDADNVYVATGDSGMGMTHGTIAGILISDLIAGRENPWAALYDPGRIRVCTAVDFLTENLNVAAQYAAWITAGEVASADEIEPNTGAVVREGVTKVAVFRDASGFLHRHSAVCPHLGCIVAWNSAASTWDCPCHGSRFDHHGEVINGPANTGLLPA